MVEGHYWELPVSMYMYVSAVRPFGTKKEEVTRNCRHRCDYENQKYHPCHRLDWAKWHNCYNFSILECPGIIKNKFSSHTMMRVSQNMQSLTENWVYTWCRLSRHWWHRRLSLPQPPVPRVTKKVTHWCPLWRRNSKHYHLSQYNNMKCCHKN